MAAARRIDLCRHLILGHEAPEEPPQPQPQPRVVLTRPVSLEWGAEVSEHGGPNIVQRVVGLFKDVRPGSDLTHFQLPAVFNMPKSQLQCYGEDVYCVSEDILGRCATGKSSLERFISVVAWNISTRRPAVFGLAPFNPILGETHHASRGSLNLLLEQVSHHPPVSAFHATDSDDSVELTWCHQLVPRFYGTSIEVLVRGRRQLKLLKSGECYEMDAPALAIKLLPVPSMEWAGKISIRCKESGLAAEICYYTANSFLGFGGTPRSVKGKIFSSKTSTATIYEIYGQWDRKVMLRDVTSGEVATLYDAKAAISKLKTPVVKDPEGVLPTESAVVWAEVTEAILSRDWERARQAKRGIEERERKLRRERVARGETWVPKHFSFSPTKDGGWDCRPNLRKVPPAPIVAPCS